MITGVNNNAFKDDVSMNLNEEFYIKGKMETNYAQSINNYISLFEGSTSPNYNAMGGFNFTNEFVLFENTGSYTQLVYDNIGPSNRKTLLLSNGTKIGDTLNVSSYSQVLNNNIVLFYNLKKISELTTNELNNILGTYISKINKQGFYSSTNQYYDLTTDDMGELLDKNTFKEQYGDCYILLSTPDYPNAYQIADNRNDGEYSNTFTRVMYDATMHYLGMNLMQEVINYTNDDFNVPNGTSIIKQFPNINECLWYATRKNSYSVIGNSVFRNARVINRVTFPSLNTIDTEQSKVFYFVGRNSSNDIFAPIEYRDGTYNTPFIVATKNMWVQLFNNIGIPWTDNQIEFTTKNVSEFGEYKPLKPFIPGSGGFDGGQGGLGGYGNNDLTSDEVIGGTIYNGGAYSFNSLWNMNFEELADMQLILSYDLWANIENTWWGANPQSGLLGLTMFPFDISRYRTPESKLQTVKISGKELSYSGSNEEKIIKGYKMLPSDISRIEMGTFVVEEFFGSFLDYEPYTSATLYIPFIGFVPLPVNSIMNKTLKLYYNVSYQDGSCLAILEADGVPILTKEGMLGQQQIINVNDWSSKALDRVVNAMSFAASAAGSITGAMSAQKIAEAPTITKTSTVNSKGVSSNTITSTKDVSFAKENKVSTAIRQNMVNAVNGLDVSSGRSKNTSVGSTTSTHGAALPIVPFIIFERPVPNMPQDYNKIYGYQTNLYETLGKLTGFTICNNVKINDIACYEEERDMIINYLSSGIIL